MKENATFASVDEHELRDVEGGIGPALIGAGYLAARAAPYVIRAAPAIWRGVTSALSWGETVIKGAGVYAGAAEAGSRVIEGQTGTRTWRPSDLLPPSNRPAAE